MSVRHFRTSISTQQLQTSFRQHLAVFLSFVVLVLFLSANCSLHSVRHMDWLRIIDIFHREARMAYRGKRDYLRTGFLPFLQWPVAEICSINCHLTTRHFPLRWTSMEHVSPVRQDIDFVGRASEWSHSRHGMCRCFHEKRAATSQSIRRRGSGRQ